MKKIITKLAPLSLLVLVVACADPYKDGLKDGQAMGKVEGYNQGKTDGQADGDAAGYARAKAYFESAGYNEGHVDGKKVGYNSGYGSGYSVGKNETYQPNYNRGYNEGYDDGEYDGLKDGYKDGYDDGRQDAYDVVYDRGYSDGYDDGVDDGYDDGYDVGFDDGYDSGFDDGYDDAYALSVGKTKQLKGYGNILSLAHNAIIDYSKITPPKQTKRGLVANGKLLLSETSLTNKDTLKRAAVVEQYLVVEMAKQVEAKFGLSTERSLKLAKASNHFRKQVSKRALTSEDTNAYATEFVGSNFSQINAAYEKTMKGDLGAFDSVLERAAKKNETSPENIAVILTNYFM